MLIRIYIRLYLLGGLKRYTIITSWGYYITKSLDCQMMHRLRRYDAFASQIWCCFTSFREWCDVCPKMWRSHASLGEAVIIGEPNIICRRQTSFKKRTFVGRQKCVFCWRRRRDLKGSAHTRVACRELSLAFAVKCFACAKREIMCYCTLWNIAPSSQCEMK